MWETINIFNASSHIKCVAGTCHKKHAEGKMALLRVTFEFTIYPGDGNQQGILTVYYIIAMNIRWLPVNKFQNYNQPWPMVC